MKYHFIWNSKIHFSYLIIFFWCVNCVGIISYHVIEINFDIRPEWNPVFLLLEWIFPKSITSITKMTSTDIYRRKHEFILSNTNSFIVKEINFIVNNSKESSLIRQPIINFFRWCTRRIFRNTYLLMNITFWIEWRHVACLFLTPGNFKYHKSMMLFQNFIFFLSFQKDLRVIYTVFKTCFHLFIVLPLVLCAIKRFIWTSA